MTWPTLPTQSANSFVDHFAGSSLNARWTPITGYTSPASGPGTVTVADSYVDFNCAAHQAAAVYFATKIDKTKSQLWTFAISLQNSGGPSDFLWLLDKATAPAVDTYTNIGAITRLRASNADTPGGGAGLQFEYFDSSHVLHYWSGSGVAWGTASAGAVAQTKAADYYVLGVEIDAINSRWRMLAWSQSYPTAGTYTWSQGLTLTALSDWVAWSSLEDTSNLWLVLGNPYNGNGVAGEWRVEWVRYSEAPSGNGVIDWWGNQGARPTANAGDTGLRHQYSYDGIIFVPEARTGSALTRGGAGTYDSQEISCPSCATDGTTDYLYYSAQNDSFTDSVCVATATHSASGPQNGPWTKYASNPIFNLPTGEKQIQFPWVFQDLSDSNSNYRWKMLVSSKRTADNFWRLRLATAPSATGPWTDQGVVIDVGTTGAFDSNAARDGIPLYVNGQWEVWYEGWDSSGFVSIGRATGPTLFSLTKDGSGARLSYSTTPDTTIAASFSGRTVTVASTSGMAQDDYCWISPGVNTSTYVTSRIRKIINSTQLELYHGVTADSTWTYPIRFGTINSSRHFSPRLLIWDTVNSQWVMLVNQWEPWLSYYGGTTGSNTYEIVEQEGGRFTNPSATPSSGSWTRDGQSWPMVSRGFNLGTDEATMENATWINQPFSIMTRTVPATAALQATLQRSIPTTAALQSTLTRSVPATTALQNTLTRAVPASAALQATLSRMVPTTVATEATLSRAVPATTALQATLQRTVPGTVALQAMLTRTVPAAAAIGSFLSRAIPASGALQATLSRAVPTAAALDATLARSVPTTISLQDALQRLVPDTVALQASLVRTVPASAAIGSFPTRTVPSTVATQATLQRILPASGAIGSFLTRIIATSAALQATNQRVIPCTVALVIGGPVPAVTVRTQARIKTVRAVKRG